MQKCPHIVLTGLMGCGKSSVGRCLAHHSGWLFSDIDSMVEAYSRRTINEIFAEEGEAAFRELETQMLDLALKDSKAGVIATGGGAVLSKINRDLMKKSGFVVYLQAEPDVLCERTSKDQTRPLLRHEDRLGTLTRLLQEREKFYLEADLILGIRQRNVRILSREIWENYRKTYPDSVIDGASDQLGYWE
ncbi:MAG: shikimate kinase [Candidatus Methylacidiphilales bacterium]